MIKEGSSVYCTIEVPRLIKCITFIFMGHIVTSTHFIAIINFDHCCFRGTIKLIQQFLAVITLSNLTCVLPSTHVCTGDKPVQNL